MPTAKAGPWLDVALAKGLLRDVTPRGRPVQAPAPPVGCSEKVFQARVVRLAKANGWRCYHPFDSRRSESGFPDLVMVRRGVLVFAELKTSTGRVTLAQAQWHALLGEVLGVRVRLWRPTLWAAVVAELCAEGGAGRE